MYNGRHNKAWAIKERSTQCTCTWCLSKSVHFHSIKNGTCIFLSYMIQVTLWFKHSTLPFRLNLNWVWQDAESDSLIWSSPWSNWDSKGNSFFSKVTALLVYFRSKFFHKESIDWICNKEVGCSIWANGNILNNTWHLRSCVTGSQTDRWNVLSSNGKDIFEDFQFTNSNKIERNMLKSFVSL